MNEPKIKSLQLSLKHRVPTTVGEMIEVLEQLPKDMKIVKYGKKLGGNEFISRAEMLFLKLQRMKDYKIVQRACKETEGSEKVLIIS